MLPDNEYDIIFMDIRMPGMSGDQVLNQINKRGLRRGVPVVALTADVLAESRDKFISMGFSDYLAKPIDARAFEKMLIQMLPKDKINVLDEHEDKGGEIAIGQVRGLFVHLGGYVISHNEEALKEERHPSRGHLPCQQNLDDQLRLRGRQGEYQRESAQVADRLPRLDAAAPAVLRLLRCLAGSGRGLPRG